MFEWLQQYDAAIPPVLARSTIPAKRSRSATGATAFGLTLLVQTRIFHDIAAAGFTSSYAWVDRFLDGHVAKNGPKRQATRSPAPQRPPEE
jgi:hypothetical protein